MTLMPHPNTCAWLFMLIGKAADKLVELRGLVVWLLGFGRLDGVGTPFLASEGLFRPSEAELTPLNISSSAPSAPCQSQLGDFLELARAVAEGTKLARKHQGRRGIPWPPRNCNPGATLKV